MAKKLNVKKIAKSAGKAVAKSAVGKAAIGGATGTLAGAGIVKDKNKENTKKLTQCTKELQRAKTDLIQANNTITDKNTKIDQKDSKITEQGKIITDQTQKIDSLNKEVSTLTTRIKGPIVETKKEGFTDDYASSNIVIRGDGYTDYDIPQSGLEQVAYTLKTKYDNYYRGYQESESLLRDKAIPQIQYLSTTDMNGLMYAYTAVQQQNKTLETQIESTSDEYSTDFQKSKYENENLQYRKKVNAIMFFGFYILVFVFAYAVFANTSLGFGIPIKSIIIVVAFFYPYWIGYVSRATMFIVKYIGSFIQGTPYESSV